MKLRIVAPVIATALALVIRPACADDDAPIQDNSFLIEEAYNQEPGVIQHISFFSRSTDTNEWSYSFTEEWPLSGQAHQISLTVPVDHAGEGSSRTGIGDVALNYRYQLIGNGEEPVAVSPRLSLIVPSGDDEKGRGTGGWGLSAGFPMSVVLSPSVTTHWNLAATYTFGAKAPAGESGGTLSYGVAQGTIWQVARRINLMLEVAWNSEETILGERTRSREEELFLSPGIRWAHDLESGLQIVPGIAFPIGVGPSRGDQSVILYLSFEHAIR